MTNLNPCPFCGKTPRLTQVLVGDVEVGDYSSEYRVYCGNDRCHAAPAVGPFGTLDAAVEAWSTKATTHPRHDETLADEMGRAKVYRATMQYLYDLATSEGNDDIYEAYDRMARAEGDLFSAAVYSDPAAVRPEDTPEDLEPWAFGIEAWGDGAGWSAIARTSHHVLLVDDGGCFSCFTNDRFMPEDMLWSFGPGQVPEHLLPLYAEMNAERLHWSAGR